MTDENKENIGKEENKKKNWFKHKLFAPYLLFVIFFVTIFCFLVQYTNTPKLVIPRYNHSAVVLNDGRILITGGETIIKGKKIILDSAEIYNPKTKKSTLIPNKMNYARTTHASVLLPSGDVLIIGGDGENKTSEIYNIRNSSFKKGANLNYLRRDVLAILYDSKHILVVDTFSPHIEIYDIIQNKFRYIESFKKPLRNTYEYANINGKLFFPIKTLDISRNSEIVTINYFDMNQNVVGELKKKKHKTNYGIFDDCRFNAISNINNSLVQFCASANYIYAETYNFEKQIFENISNKQEIFGLNALYPIVLDSSVLILGDIHSKTDNTEKYEILYKINNNQISLTKRPLKKFNKRSKLITTKKETYVIGGYYVLPILGFEIVSKKIEVLK